MSKIEVNKIGPQCGTTLTVGCGSGQTVTVDANTVTLGRSGGTVSLASGATQSGFGRTGTVDWQTTPKTASFTAVNGEGYFINTTSSAITMTMPSGSAGAIVSIQDYNKTFDTNSLTVTPASGEKINGGTADGPLNVSTEGQGLTFVYVDSTVGWKTVHENEFITAGSSFINATGGTIVDCGNFRTHIFTGPGTFSVAAIAQSAPNNTVDYLVVAGGGSGPTLNGGDGQGGGGAGGMRFFSTAPGSNHPINNSGASPNTSITVTATDFPITVGAGGSAAIPGNPGSNSVFSTVTSAGGGAGGHGSPGPNGGSGGGGSGGSPVPGGTGNTPPTSPPQGNNGGASSSVTPNNQSGAGGGAGAVGGNGDGSGGGDGGAGAYIADPFIGPTAPSYGTPGPVSSTRYFAGGGGGAGRYGPGAAGAGGGGIGSSGSSGPSQVATAGTANTGGGGGGGSDRSGGKSGGSGIVMIRYKYQ